MHKQTLVDPRYNDRSRTYFRSMWETQSDWPDAPQPTRQVVSSTAKVASDIATYRTDGKVQVIPKEGPITMATPTSWPPIPPSYVPRPGTLVQLPWIDTFHPSDRPQPQVYGKMPVIKRAASVQRGWYTSNPGMIDVRGLETSPANAFTVDRAGEPWRPL